MGAIVRNKSPLIGVLQQRAPDPDHFRRKSNTAILSQLLLIEDSDILSIYDLVFGF